MPAPSLQELVSWKWNASCREASLDGVCYWFGADDGCSSCLWLSAPHRPFLLQVNNKQQKARKNSRTGSIVWLHMPSTLNTMCIRAAPLPSIFLGYCGVLFDIYFTPRKGSGHIHQTVCEFSKGAILTDMTLAHKEKNTLYLQRRSSANSSQNTDGTSTSGTSPFLLYPQAPGTASGHLAKYLQAKNTLS